MRDNRGKGSAGASPYRAEKRPDRREAFALILVMMVIIVLSSIVAGFAIAMRTEMTLARNHDYDSELEWMGRSGVELARYALVEKCPETRGIDALNQLWAGGTAPCSNDVPDINLKDLPLGDGHISVTIVDMERKWSINMVANPRAPQTEILQRAFQEIGLNDPERVSTISDSLMDWVNLNPEGGFGGATAEYYETLNPPYTCKNGPIDDLSELLLVKGITPEMYWGSADASNHPVSAYTQSAGSSAELAKPQFRNDHPDVFPIGLVELFSPLGGKLNINTASAKTIALIPNIDEPTAGRIIQERAGPDGIDGTEDDAPFQNPGEIMGGLPGGSGGNVQGGPQGGIAAAQMAQFVDVRSYVFEVHVEAEINGYKREFVGVISRSGPSAAAIKCVRFYWE